MSDTFQLRPVGRVEQGAADLLAAAGAAHA